MSQLAVVVHATLFSALFHLSSVTDSIITCYNVIDCWGNNHNEVSLVLGDTCGISVTYICGQNYKK